MCKCLGDVFNFRSTTVRIKCVFPIYTSSRSTVKLTVRIIVWQISMHRFLYFIVFHSILCSCQIFAFPGKDRVTHNICKGNPRSKLYPVIAMAHTIQRRKRNYNITVSFYSRPSLDRNMTANAVEPRPTAIQVMQSPRHHGQFFWSRENGHTFS